MMLIGDPRDGFFYHDRLFYTCVFFCVLVSLAHSVMGWSVICERSISLSYTGIVISQPK